ncbi:hypothetical protein ABIB40_004204 [Pedobacter sp. UYP30]|uniref:hypothetical protein n=1 Tax=Pedobacter sp. UYP30 TaxID=1756400 RepID=UPI00339A9E9B
MRLKRTSKKVVLYGSAVFFIFVLLVGLKTYFEVNLTETNKTKYFSANEENEQIIETDFFRIKTPKSWVHISSGFGVEGDPYGYFLTKNGIVFYEYGFFAPGYQQDNKIDRYKVERRTIGRLRVNIAINQNKETGIAILPQYEMNRTMTFYMGMPTTANLNELLEGIKGVKFKKR